MGAIRTPTTASRSGGCSTRCASLSVENFNGQFKGIFDVQGAVPTKGLTNTRRFALGAVLVYQPTLWYRHGSSASAWTPSSRRREELSPGLS